MSARIEVLGYVGKDAEVRQGREGKSFVTFNLSSYDNRSKNTTWYRATFFNRDERFANMLTKGKHIVVWGRLDAKMNESSGKHYLNLDIIGSEVEFLDRKTNGDDTGVGGEGKADVSKAKASDPWQQTDEDVPFLDSSPSRGAWECWCWVTTLTSGKRYVLKYERMRRVRFPSLPPR